MVGSGSGKIILIRQIVVDDGHVHVCKNILYLMVGISLVEYVEQMT